MIGLGKLATVDDVKFAKDQLDNCINQIIEEMRVQNK